MIARMHSLNGNLHETIVAFNNMQFVSIFAGCTLFNLVFYYYIFMCSLSSPAPNFLHINVEKLN